MGLGFEEPLKRFKEWLDAHHEDITRNLTSFVEAVKPFVKAFSEAAGKVAEFAGAVIKWLGPNTTAWLAVAALVAKFTGIGNILTVAVIPAVYRLATALGALLMGSSGAAIRALGGLAGFFGAPAVAAILGGAAALYPSPAGEGEDERQHQARSGLLQARPSWLQGQAWRDAGCDAERAKAEEPLGTDQGMARREDRDQGAGARDG